MDDERNGDVKLCLEALGAKTRAHTRRWRYYDGDHPIAYVSDKLATLVPNSTVFKTNMCQVVVDATERRLVVHTWNHPEARVAESLKELWKKSLRKCSANVHRSVLTTGEGYLVVWEGPDKKPRAYYHDPRQAHVLYDEADPDAPRVACKVWHLEKEHFLNLYYTDRIEHYAARGEAPSWGAYKPYPDAASFSEAHNFGVIPVFHFRLDVRKCTGELTEGVLSLQDAINKLLNDMMVSSEFDSFPQRWGIGNWETGSKVPIGPGVFAQFPGSAQGDQPAEVGTFDTGTPENFLKPMDNLAFAMAIQSSTPRHYFTGQSGDPSGEALQAMEAPLVAKVEAYQEVLGDTWSRVAAFALQLSGTTVDIDDIEAVWKAAHTMQPKSQAETRKTNAEAGIPIENQLRDEGWTEEQLEQLREDRAAAGGTTNAGGNVLATGGAPQTPADVAPRFDGVVRTPDLAGRLAETGALSRAVNRARSNGAAAQEN